MIVEFVGIGAVHGYVFSDGSDIKSLAKQINKETGVATDIRDKFLVVGNSQVPVGSAVVISNGGVRTLSKEAFESQYREVSDFDISDLVGRVEKLESASKPAKPSEAVAEGTKPKVEAKK